MKRTLIFLFFVLAACAIQAQNAAAPAKDYTEKDSTIVCQLLREGLRQKRDTNLMLFYGHKFLGTPYVAATLEGNAEECLVVNVRQLDCTTFVETVTALVLTTHQGSMRFADYCANLQKIRYTDGRLQGYASRNHYFSQWITNAERMGVAREMRGDRATDYQPFVGQQTIRVGYMTRHPKLYPMMSDNRALQREVAQKERNTSGQEVRYIPTRLLGGSREELHDVQDGDVLALVTSREGLDVSHVGIAEWGRDGRLHLLNASSQQKKVVLDTMSLFQYMRKNTTNLGIRVIRIN